MSPVLAFIGGGLGAWLVYRSANHSTAQTELQGRRDEWGRRFTAALTDFVSTDLRQRTLGRAMIVALLRSELASADDRDLATRILEADVARGVHVGGTLRNIRSDVEFVQGRNDEGGEE